MGSLQSLFRPARSSRSPTRIAVQSQLLCNFRNHCNHFWPCRILQSLFATCEIIPIAFANRSIRVIALSRIAGSSRWLTQIADSSQSHFHPARSSQSPFANRGIRGKSLTALSCRAHQTKLVVVPGIYVDSRRCWTEDRDCGSHGKGI